MSLHHTFSWWSYREGQPPTNTAHTRDSRWYSWFLPGRLICFWGQGICCSGTPGSANRDGTIHIHNTNSHQGNSYAHYTEHGQTKLPPKEHPCSTTGTKWKRRELMGSAERFWFNRKATFTAPRQKSYCLHRREHWLYPGCQQTTLYKTCASFHLYNVSIHQATHLVKHRCYCGTWNCKTCTKHVLDEAEGSPACCIYGLFARAHASFTVKPVQKWCETSEKQLRYNKIQ